MTDEERDSILHFHGSVDDFFAHVANMWFEYKPTYFFKWGDVFPVPANMRWVFDELDNPNNADIMEVVAQTRPYQLHHRYSENGVHVFDYVFEKGFHNA